MDNFQSDQIVKTKLTHDGSIPLLDLLRGVSALMVLLGHVHSMTLLPYESSKLSIFGKAFYFLTGFGHQSVIVFFVISGFLIGRTAWRGYAAGTFDWRRFFSDRLSRLWAVAIPALLMTFVLDATAMQFDNHGYYSGKLSFILHMWPNPEGVDLGFDVFISNAFFLQTITVPVFGSNGPLWSLANEFWYYVLCPLLFGIFFLSRAKKIMATVGFFVLIWFVGSKISIYGLIWLMGAFVGIYWSDRNVSNVLWLRALAFILFVSALLAVRINVIADYTADFAVGVATTFLVFAFINMKKVIFPSVIKKMSDVSFSLYAIHFPVISFLWVIFFDAKQKSLDNSLLTIAVLLGVTFICTLVMHWLFESRTKVLRNIFYNALSVEHGKTAK